MKAAELKGKHVEKLLEHLRGDSDLARREARDRADDARKAGKSEAEIAKAGEVRRVGEAAIRNTLAHVRWLAEKTNRASVVQDNKAYQLEPRRRSDENVARELRAEQLARITDKRTALSLRLQREFGLRRAESILIRPGHADQGDKLVLKGSWCKGGRPREIPIRTDSQRALLREARGLVGEHASMIRANHSFKDQLNKFTAQIEKAGIDRPHGHRHAYAQDRYRELTGLEPPKCGGPSRRHLPEEERARVNEARLIISNELGHNRDEIVSTYVGV